MNTLQQQAMDRTGETGELVFGLGEPGKEQSAEPAVGAEGSDVLGLTDAQIIAVFAQIASCSLNVTRVHELGGKTRTIMEDEGAIEIGRALLAASREAGQ